MTDYQFISVILSQYDMSPNQVWFEYHVYPTKGQEYFDIYKEFFINKLKSNKIEIIYTIKPMWGGEDFYEDIINPECLKKSQVTKILDAHLILKCDHLK